MRKSEKLLPMPREFWTKGQAAEMALDAHMQQQRMLQVYWRTARKRSICKREPYCVVVVGMRKQSPMI
ncbi:hypothetical protein F7734_57200 [Scytonema sp. UIC 10036]|uniref:hypothetical protein n=1 Tax=Scytonema sp. UIC 10036 TaxID=2304196 RepID=UPI0012DAA5D5|nr:hypothetical protein [Scytonema sp. UIC 10036]MUH01311.1 hypothetical protein [Scytonema sp. UIC 10036]